MDKLAITLEETAAETLGKTSRNVKADTLVETADDSVTRR